MRKIEHVKRAAQWPTLVAHDCGYPLSRYTCRATRVAADFLDFIAFCRCSSGVAPHPLKMLVSHLSPPPPHSREVSHRSFGSEKVSRYTGVSQVQLRVVALLCATKPSTNPLFLWGVLKVKIESFKRDWILSIFGPLGMLFELCFKQCQAIIVRVHPWALTRKLLTT